MLFIGQLLLCYANTAFVKMFSRLCVFFAALNVSVVCVCCGVFGCGFCVFGRVLVVTVFL